MNKSILKKIVYLAIALSIIILVIGCKPPLSGDEEALIGKWAQGSTEMFDFKSDHTLNFLGALPGTWSMDTSAGQLTVTIPLLSTTQVYDYSFSADKNTLTLDYGSGPQTLTRM